MPDPLTLKVLVQGKVKGYGDGMRIGELAEHSGVPAKTIRFYESSGLLPAPNRTPGGYRDYDPAALPRLAFVRAAQACGLSLAEVRQVIDVREQTGPPCAHVAALLDRHAAELTARIAELTCLLAEVHRLRARATQLDPAACGAAEVCHIIPTGH